MVSFPKRKQNDAVVAGPPKRTKQKGRKKALFGNAVERAGGDGQPDQQRRFGNFFHQSEVCASCATYIKPKRLHFQNFTVNSLRVSDSP